MWFHGVVGSGIWLRLGRVLDLSCLHSPPRPHYERPHHVTVATEVEPCAAPEGGAYAEASVAARHARSESDSSNRSTTGTHPHQMLPRWLHAVVREMPEDLEVGRWLAAKGYDTMLRRYHLDTAPPPLLGQHMRNARLEVVDVRGLPSPSEACPGTFLPCASNVTAIGHSNEAADAHTITDAGTADRHRATSTPATAREACGGASSRAVLRTGWTPERPCSCVQDEEVLNCGENHPLVWRLLHHKQASSLAVRAMHQCDAHGRSAPGLPPLRQCNPRNRSSSLPCATWTPF